MTFFCKELFHLALGRVRMLAIVIYGKITRCRGENQSPIGDIGYFTFPSAALFFKKKTEEKLLLLNIVGWRQMISPKKPKNIWSLSRQSSGYRFSPFWVRISVRYSGLGGFFN